MHGTEAVIVRYVRAMCAYASVARTVRACDVCVRFFCTCGTRVRCVRTVLLHVRYVRAMCAYGSFARTECACDVCVRFFCVYDTCVRHI